MEEELKEGDVVRLKSGSPDMTVTEVEIGIYISVIYWNPTASKFVKDRFMSNQLEKVQQAE